MTYERLIEEFKKARQSKGLSSQDVAGPNNCQVYSFEKKKRFIKATTLMEWLDKMGLTLKIVKQKTKK